MSAQAHDEGSARLRVPPEVDGFQASMMGLRPEDYLLARVKVVTFECRREVGRDREARAKRAARVPTTPGAPRENQNREDQNREEARGEPQRASSRSFHRQWMTKNASTSTCGWPEVPSTFRSSECAPAVTVLV